jgi:hypothetical protein
MLALCSRYRCILHIYFQVICECIEYEIIYVSLLCNTHDTYSYMYIYIFIIIPSTLHTYVYIYATYRLQECVCFRIDAHTAAEQQPNTNTDKYNITYKFIQVKTVSDLYRHRLIALIVYYIPIIPPNYYHLY